MEYVHYSGPCIIDVYLLYVNWEITLLSEREMLRERCN